MVLFSGRRVGHQSPVSTLALLETIAASTLGLLLVLSGEYWVFWTSFFLTLIVHLRSDMSVENGVKIFNQGLNRGFLSSVSKRSKILCAVATLGFSMAVMFVLSKELFDELGQAWSYADMALFSYVTLNVVYASGVFGVVLLLCFTSNPEPDASMPELSKSTLPVLIILSIVCIPGNFLVVTFCFVAVRAIATMKYLSDGLSNILPNWIDLILRTDLTTEPELIPGLPDDHPFSFAKIKSVFVRPERDAVSNIGALFSMAFFLPSIIYRLILKSTFWFYAPLLWAASPPRGLKKKPDGTFLWDPSLARTPVDFLAALVAFVYASWMIYWMWDNSAYQAASAWAQMNDFPAFWPLLAAGIDPARIDPWSILPAFAALSALGAYVWAIQISVRVRNTDWLPGQRTLWCLYKLNSAKNSASILTVILGFAVLIMYYGEHCQLPSLLQSIASTFGDADCNYYKPV
jgi:hypothetical protein